MYEGKGLVGATSPRGKGMRAPHSNSYLEVRMMPRVGSVVLELDLVLREELFAGSD